MDEREPVQDSEYVYRRIPRTFYDAEAAIPVQRAAFRPTENDTTGLSVFRSCLCQPAITLVNVEAVRAKDYYVARLAVRELQNLGLTVVAEPAPGGPPGHAVIAELSWQAYQADKQRLKEIQLELAKLASADIVHRPDAPEGAEQ